MCAEQLQYTFLVETLRGEVGLGQAQALALARERGAELLLVDDRRGRAVATRLGIPHVGLLALLLEARRKGRIKAHNHHPQVPKKATTSLPLG